ERVSDTENRSTITTARVVDNAVMGYILSLPNTTIEAAHATLDGRMTVIGTEEVAPTVSTSLYNDVIPTDWFYTAVNFVTEQKLMSGANGLFSPNEYVTRGMFAEILYDLAGIYPIANRPDEYLTRQEMAVFMFQYFGSTPVEGSLSFDDADDIAYWAYDAVVYSFVNGLLRGVSETTFAPNQLTTRAQLATVLARMLAE
ncbi:MAG: S-layer homology domain-containing protein, partial [Defluviitaleaceae bacterium]|nr:S-layer homology domain-containing protein [Defluviitaleaceae bacterium]